MQRMWLNCSGRRVAVVDSAGSLTLLDVRVGEGHGAQGVKLEKLPVRLRSASMFVARAWGASKRACMPRRKPLSAHVLYVHVDRGILDWQWYAHMMIRLPTDGQGRGVGGHHDGLNGLGTSNCLVASCMTSVCCH